MPIFRDLKEGDKVFVYFNLHKETFSVKNLSTRLVVAHLDHVNLKEAFFKVSQRGRQKVLKEKRKNVHAGIIGIFTFENLISDDEKSEKATYNPYKYDSFVNNDTFEKISNAKSVYLKNNLLKPSIHFKN